MPAPAVISNFLPPPGHRGAMGYILEQQNLVAALASSLATRPGVSLQPRALERLRARHAGAAQSRRMARACAPGY
jgi:hypothetical protein